MLLWLTSNMFLLQGLLLSVQDKFTDVQGFLRLWRNECLRIFHDRLINQDDKAVVLGQITDLINSKYGGAAEHVLADPSLFGDFRYVFICAQYVSA